MRGRISSKTMKCQRNPNFLVFFTITLILVSHIHYIFARPNSAHGNRRNSAEKTKDNKGKRSWLVSPPSDEIEPLKSDNLLGLDESVMETLDMESSTNKEATGPLVPRKWLELEGVLPPQIRAKSNSGLTLECIAVGSPPPTIYWLKDGKPIENVTPFDTEQLANHVLGRALFRKPQGKGFAMSKVKSKIPLRCLKPELEGEYTCVADNDGRQLISTTTIIIDDEAETEVRPECGAKVAGFSYSKKGKKGQPAYILSSESLHMEAIGRDIILTCRAAGRPRPKVSWLDSEGNKVINGKKFHVTHSGNLVIRSLSWSEMGEYTCLVENQFGNEVASTFLYPLMTEES